MWEEFLCQEQSLKNKSPRGAKTALVLDAIQRRPGEFSVADLQKKCPGVSLDTIRLLLENLRSEQVECSGRSHQARWRRKAIR